MSISIDGMLGSARKITQKRSSGQQNRNSNVETSRDTVIIETRLNGRLGSIHGELKDMQSELTKRQVIQNGLQELLSDIKSGSQRQESILSETRYNNQAVLADFLGEGELSESFLSSRMNDNSRKIQDEIAALSRMQIESENILASNLISNPSFSSSEFSAGDAKTESISRLQADVVMRLTK